MVDDANIDEPISKRLSKRSCRLSAVKPEPIIVKKEVEAVVDGNNQAEEEEEEEEDPVDNCQSGDIFWVRVAGNPWWPALIYGSYYEDNLHTKVVKTARRPKRRRYFVYFFGPDFEYIWSDANTLIPYAGLEDFIQQAETTVQNAVKKSEQEALATRFELKVPANKRAQWDKAIEEADKASKLTREERSENFADILKTILSKANKKIASAAKQKTPHSIPARSSLKKTSNEKRSSVKRQRTKSTPVSTSTTLLHVGLPVLTAQEEMQIVDSLLASAHLNLNEAQSMACQLVMNIIKENYQTDMSCVQIEWFYDFLLNHPEIPSKYSHWFNDDIKPIFDDSISFKQCQLKDMLQKK